MTGVGLDATRPTLVAATSQGFLLGFALDGTRRWCRLLEEGISHLIPRENAFVVQEHSGRARLIDTEGDDLAVSGGEVPRRCWCTTPSALWLASGGELRRIP